MRADSADSSGHDVSQGAADDAPEMLWRPTEEQVEGTRIADFRKWLRDNRGVDVADYDELWSFSVNSIPEFWSAVADYFGVRWHTEPAEVLSDARMPGARVVPRRHAELRRARAAPVAGGEDGRRRLRGDLHREDGGRADAHLWHSCGRRSARRRAALRELGVGKGDRVVALVPNCPETLGRVPGRGELGAVWSSCSPDFGARAVVDRFTQIEPKVLHRRRRLPLRRARSSMYVRPSAVARDPCRRCPAWPVRCTSRRWRDACRTA